MNATAISTSAIESLAPLLAQAKSRSQALRRAVLVSLTLPYDGPQPNLDATSHGFVWQQPSREIALLGSGTAATIDSSGANRFGHVREGLSRLFAEAVIQGAPPLALAGFSFDPQQPHEERWQAFPDGRATLPRLLFARRDASSSLTLNCLVDQNADLDAISRSLADELSTATRPSVCADSPSSVQDDADARSRWLANVSDLTRRIANGEADKVVLARRVDLETTGSFALGAVIERLAQRYPNTTVFAVRTEDACFLGATPETLVRLEGRTVRADCLAGSYRRGATDAEDEALGAALLTDDKERREHAIVARALTDSLREVCTDLQLPETPVLKRMANVQHLHTPIEATTDGDRHVLELVERLHPTPATAGLPRERSLCLIRSHEPFSRGWYAGPIGWLDSEGNGEFAVALRSAVLNGNQASLYAGCGIVSGSDPAREYDESAIKLEAMLWALNAQDAIK